MAPRPKTKKQAGRTGITHFPLPEERDSQERVPSRGKSGGKGTQEPGVGGRGHRLSRKPAPQPTPQRDGQAGAKGVKGGKTGGSRAGLLSTSRKVAHRRSTRK